MSVFNTWREQRGEQEDGICPSNLLERELTLMTFLMFGTFDSLIIGASLSEPHIQMLSPRRREMSRYVSVCPLIVPDD